MDFVSVLDDCLARIGAGESVASCLERYSAEAHELAPLLAAAEPLHVLSTARLAQGQRLRAKVALRETLANQRQPVRPPFLSRLRGLPVATALAVVLFVGVAISAVASSQPGDLAYPVRVVVERAPVWVHLSNEGRATAELITVERRLDDVSESALHAGDVSPVALNALLQGVEAAVLRAERLPDEERAVLAARVSTQAAALLRLADAATDPETAARLRAVAQRVARAAGKLELRAPIEVEASQEPTPTLAVIDATATRRSTMAPGKPRPTTVPATVTATVTATRRVEPTPIVPPAATVVTSETPTPSVPDMTPIATPEVSIPQLTQTPRWPLPTSQTPQHTRTPRPRSTIVIPTIVVPTFVVPTIVVPTFVAPTPVVPSRQTRTPEPTGTASAAADPPTATDTPVPISTATAVSTMRPTRTPTVTVAPSLTATRYFSMPTATMTLTPTPTETSRFIPLLTATPTVSGPRATRTALANLTATVTATGTLTSTPTPRGPRATAFAGTVTATPAWVPTGAAPTSVPPPVGIPTRPPRPR